MCNQHQHSALKYLYQYQRTIHISKHLALFNFKIVAMFNFTDKLSPRVIGSAIKSRLSGQVPTRNGSPYNKVINRVTKTSKIAKDPRYKKQNNCRFSATAMLIVSQIGIRFLHQAVAQVSKPVIHRRVNTLPHESETAMVVDEVPAQPKERVVEMADQPEDHIVEMAD